MEKIEVHILECERGWGSRIDETKGFDTMKEAEEFCEDFNKDNNLSKVPDWYMVAIIQK